jgi:hypothetical protein
MTVLQGKLLFKYISLTMVESEDFFALFGWWVLEYQISSVCTIVP